jgi:hypothetical protein
VQEALLQALHSVKDGQLPLAGGQLWNSFLLPGRRAGTHLDLKASSHKKLSKLLQVCPIDFDAKKGLFWREAPEPRGAQLCILLQGHCSQDVLKGPAHAHIAAIRSRVHQDAACPLGPATHSAAPNLEP